MALTLEVAALEGLRFGPTEVADLE